MVYLTSYDRKVLKFPPGVTSSVIAGIILFLIFGAGAFAQTTEDEQVEVSLDEVFILVVNMNLSSGTTGSPNRISDAVKACGGITIIEHYADLTSDRIESIEPTAIILSGQGSPWDDYPVDELDAFKQLIRENTLPVLGICGGHQFLALTFEGGTVDRIERLEPGEGYEGCFKESGYQTVEWVTENDIFDYESEQIVVYESHYDEVKTSPELFEILASNETCEIQAMRHKTRPIYGTQFHPEIWDETHPDGQTIMRSFLESCLLSAEVSDVSDLPVTDEVRPTRDGGVVEINYEENETRPCGTGKESLAMIFIPLIGASMYFGRYRR